MSIKVGCISHDMRILGRIVRVRSTEQSAGIIVGGFCPQHHKYYKTIQRILQQYYGVSLTSRLIFSGIPETSVRIHAVASRTSICALSNAPAANRTTWDGTL